MVFSPQDALVWLKKHKWLVAFAVVLMFGYSVGKDMALRDNAADQQFVGEAS